MSSGDTVLHSTASIGIRDGLKLYLPLTDNQEKTGIRILIVAVAALSYASAVGSGRSIFELYSAAYGGIAQLLPVIVAALYWPASTREGAISGLVAGVSVSVFLFFFPEYKPLPLHEGIYGLAINIGLLIGISRYQRSRRSQVI